MTRIMQLIAIQFVIIHIAACNSDKVPECSNRFLFKIKTDSIQNVFNITPVLLLDGSCSYLHKYTYWLGLPVKEIPFLQYSGVVYNDSGCIYLVPGNHRDTVKYFDFAMPIGSQEYISWNQMVLNIYGDSITQNIHYQLSLETVTFERKYRDSLFKFRFKGIGIMHSDDDLVFYIGKKVGVVGMYNGIVSDTSEEIYSFYGDILDSKKHYVSHRML